MILFDKEIQLKRLYAHIQLANELWYYDRRDDSTERQTKLFGIGWYTIEPRTVRYYYITLAWLSIKWALIPKNIKEVGNESKC